jgi:stage II sporulation protein P
VTVKKILEENPSIKIVLDIHRDAIEKADGCRVAPTTEINGKSAAQVMIICGCDDGTMNMPNYMKNFRFASLVQQQMESDYPTLTRPVLFDYRKYNQDLTTGSILVEVGGHANSIDQAIYSGELIGKSLANALLSISE